MAFAPAFVRRISQSLPHQYCQEKNGENCSAGDLHVRVWYVKLVNDPKCNCRTVCWGDMGRVKIIYKPKSVPNSQKIRRLKLPHDMSGQVQGPSSTCHVQVMFFLFSMYLIPFSEIPNGWVWMTYLSPQSYAFNAMILRELDGDPFDPCIRGVVATLCVRCCGPSRVGGCSLWDGRRGGGGGGEDASLPEFDTSDKSISKFMSGMDSESEDTGSESEGEPVPVFCHLLSLSFRLPHKIACPSDFPKFYLHCRHICLRPVRCVRGNDKQLLHDSRIEVRRSWQLMPFNK